MDETTQLLIVAEATSATEPALQSLLDRHAAACVLIVPAGWRPRPVDDERSEALEAEPSGATMSLDRGILAALVAAARARGITALVASDIDAARESGADGCHLDATAALEERYRTARAFLGTDASIGAMPGASRHLAMSLAEAGVDYVGYTVTTDPDNAGADLLAWWAEIFECPVVAFTDGSIEASRAALEAGPPEFLAVPLSALATPGHLDATLELVQTLGILPQAN